MPETVSSGTLQGSATVPEPCTTSATATLPSGTLPWNRYESSYSHCCRVAGVPASSESHCRTSSENELDDKLLQSGDGTSPVRPSALRSCSVTSASVAASDDDSATEMSCELSMPTPIRIH